MNPGPPDYKADALTTEPSTGSAHRRQRENQVKEKKQDCIVEDTKAVGTRKYEALEQWIWRAKIPTGDLSTFR